MIHGINENHTCPVVGFSVDLGAGVGMVDAESSRLRSAGEVQVTPGDHTFRNRIRQPIEISDAPMSTIHGLMKLEMRNCGTANDAPVTRMAGQTCSMPRKP